MEYFARLDVSIKETHICIVDREGGVAYEMKVASIPADIDAALLVASACRRVVFRDGPDGADAFHGLIEGGAHKSDRVAALAQGDHFEPTWLNHFAHTRAPKGLFPQAKWWRCLE